MDGMCPWCGLSAFQKMDALFDNGPWPKKKGAVSNSGRLTDEQSTLLRAMDANLTDAEPVRNLGGTGPARFAAQRPVARTWA